MPMKINCAICRRKDFRRLFRKSGYTIVKCSNCGLVYANPQPTREELKNFYQEEYFTEETNYGYSDSSDNFESKVRTMSERISPLYEIYRKSNKLLDAGSGLGYFLKASERTGWDAFGVDISKYAVQKCQERGLKAIVGDLSELPFDNGSFDIVRSASVLEHVRKPRKVLTEAWRVLRLGGLLEIETVNVGSPRVKLIGENWWEFKPPEHLFYYDKKTLKILLESEGFKIKKIQPSGNMKIAQRAAQIGINPKSISSNRLLKNMKNLARPILKPFLLTHVRVYAEKIDS